MHDLPEELKDIITFVKINFTDNKYPEKIFLERMENTGWKRRGKVKINTLKMFVELVDIGSYSLVADKLDLTQPAVSMQIKALEERFETDLVIKEKGEIKLTPAGKIVYSDAKEILNVWEKLLFRVDESKGRIYQNLTIGSSTIPSEYLLPDILAKFSEKMPDIRSSIEVGDSEEMIKLLEKREVDLIIVGYKPKNSKYVVKEITDDNLKLITPQNHWLTDKNSIYVEDIRDEEILIREVGSGTRKAMMEGLRKTGLSINDLNIKSRLGSTEAIISGVQAGLGISFVSNLASFKADSCSRIKELNVEDMQCKRKFYLAFNKNRKNEEIIEKFIGLF